MPEWQRRLGRPTSKWEDNIEMDIRKIGWGVMDCVHLSLNKDQWKVVMNTIINLRVP
jgi:hypothetical protein